MRYYHKYQYVVRPYPSCQILMKLGFSRLSFEIYSIIEFHENTSSGCRVVPCGRTDMMKLVVAFRNFTNAPKNDLRTQPLSNVPV